MSTTASPPVTWRDGIHIAGTSIWCDAKRARDICFVSSAGALSTARHGQLIATGQTLKLLERADGQAVTASQLSTPFGRPFTLGTQRIETFASGHTMGSASLLVEAHGKRVVYAAAINPRGSRLGGSLDHRSCDVLVVSARYGRAESSFPDQATVQEQLLQWCRNAVEGDRVAALFVSGVGKALDVHEFLSEAGLPCTAQRSIYDGNSRLQRGGYKTAALQRWSPTNSQGRVLLWPLALRDKLPAAVSASALVSGNALLPENLQLAGADEGFAWSNQADFAELQEYIETSGAEQVFLTHTTDQGEALRAALPNRGVHAIGPPEQLELFS